MRRASNATVLATVGVGSMNFWQFTVSWSRGGGGGLQGRGAECIARGCKVLCLATVRICADGGLFFQIDHVVGAVIALLTGPSHPKVAKNGTFGASRPSLGFKAPDGRVHVWCVAIVLPHSMPLGGGGGGVLHLFLDSLTYVLNSDPESILSGDSESPSSVGGGAAVLALHCRLERMVGHQAHLG